MNFQWHISQLDTTATFAQKGIGIGRDHINLRVKNGMPPPKCDFPLSFANSSCLRYVAVDFSKRNARGAAMGFCTAINHLTDSASSYR